MTELTRRNGGATGVADLRFSRCGRLMRVLSGRQAGEVGSHQPFPVAGHQQVFDGVVDLKRQRAEWKSVGRSVTVRRVSQSGHLR